MYLCIVGVTFGGFLYIAGGEKYNNSMTPVDSVFRYDPRNSTWLKVASMNHQRQSFSLAVLNNRMYAVGNVWIFILDSVHLEIFVE